MLMHTPPKNMEKQEVGVNGYTCVIMIMYTCTCVIYNNNNTCTCVIYNNNNNNNTCTCVLVYV